VSYRQAVADLVYPPILLVARGVFFGLGISFDLVGSEHIPRTGGGVLASNHVSYLDFTFCGLAARPSKRLVRFMAKDSTFTHKLSGPLMRGMHHIPVDRSAGAAAYDRAVADLRAGEIVGVFPEATISRSFVLKDFKTGAARMAAAAGVPLIPMATWGGQRIYTKGHPRDLSRGKAVTLAVGEPFIPAPDDDPVRATEELKRRVGLLVEGLQRTYPQAPADESDRWWLPRYLDGTAPTLDEANALDDAENAARRRPKP
jgi:1-acyl-sn-glycerol-3-phosphate acyltransferase